MPTVGLMVDPVIQMIDPINHPSTYDTDVVLWMSRILWHLSPIRAVAQVTYCPFLSAHVAAVNIQQ